MACQTVKTVAKALSVLLISVNNTSTYAAVYNHTALLQIIWPWMGSSDPLYWPPTQYKKSGPAACPVLLCYSQKLEVWLPLVYRRGNALSSKLMVNSWAWSWSSAIKRSFQPSLQMLPCWCSEILALPAQGLPSPSLAHASSQLFLI